MTAIDSKHLEALKKAMTQPKPANCDCLLPNGLMKSSCFDGICKCSCHNPTQPKPEWEKEFDKIAPTIDWRGYPSRDTIKSFIRQLLLEARLEAHKESYQKGFIDGGHASSVQGEEIKADELREIIAKERAEERERIMKLIDDQHFLSIPIFRSELKRAIENLTK